MAKRASVVAALRSAIVCSCVYVGVQARMSLLDMSSLGCETTRVLQRPKGRAKA